MDKKVINLEVYEVSFEEVDGNTFDKYASLRLTRQRLRNISKAFGDQLISK